MTAYRGTHGFKHDCSNLDLAVYCLSEAETWAEAMAHLLFIEQGLKDIRQRLQDEGPGEMSPDEVQSLVRQVTEPAREATLSRFVNLSGEEPVQVSYPVVRQPDPVLERLLAEEEAIEEERRLQAEGEAS